MNRRSIKILSLLLIIVLCLIARPQKALAAGKNMANATITLSNSSYTYDGTAKRPTVTVKYGANTLKNGTHYTLTYSNNINPGTASVKVTGKGAYLGSVTKYYTINKKNIASTTITIAFTSTNYTGNHITPKVTIKDGNKRLIAGADFTTTYTNNLNPGTATITIQGAGKYYQGKTIRQFTIKATGDMIVAEAKKHLGKPYVKGGNGPNSFDCSGFTKYVYGLYGYTLGRTVEAQASNGKSVGKSELKAGDLVIFNGYDRSEKYGHVGIYIGDNKFIHAGSSKTGVLITSLSEDYYSTRYVCARRIIY